MKPFFALVYINLLDLLLSTFGSKFSSKKKTRQRSGWMVLFILAGLMLYISGLYSYLLAQILAPLGRLDSLLGLMLFFGVFFCTTLTLYLAQSLLFSAKDNRQLFSFPVSAFSILLARLSALYLEVLFIMEVFLLPTGIVYLLFSQNLSLLFLPTLLLVGVFLSFIPTLISLLFGLVNTFVISKTPFKHFFTILIGFLTPLAMMVLSFTFSSSSVSAGGILALGERLLIPPFSWAVRACTGDPISLFLLATLCVLPFFFFVLCISRFYKPLLTSMLGEQRRTNFRLQPMQTKTPFFSLFLKEAKRFFQTPSYFLNCSFSLILLLLAAFSSVFFRSTLSSVITPLMQSLPGGIPFDTQGLWSIVLLSFLCFVSLSFQPSAVSLSLEAKSLWILKTAPVSSGTVFAAKIAFPLACSFPCFLLATPLLGFFLSLSAWQCIELCLLATAGSTLSSVLGIILNLKHPRLDATNDTVVVKQSLSTFLGLLFGFLQAFVVVSLYAVCVLLGFGVFSFLPSFLLLLAACFLAIGWLRKNGDALFLALN